MERERAGDREDSASLKAAYPEGIYEFEGRSVTGETLHGRSRLRHTPPGPAVFVRPGTEARGIAVRGMDIAWKPVHGAAAYIVEIEQDEADVSLSARLPGSAAAFTVPDGFLTPGTQYHLAIGAVDGEGNASFVETTFETSTER